MKFRQAETFVPRRRRRWTFAAAGPMSSVSSTSIDARLHAAERETNAWHLEGDRFAVAANLRRPFDVRDGHLPDPAARRVAAGRSREGHDSPVPSGCCPRDALAGVASGAYVIAKRRTPVAPGLPEHGKTGFHRNVDRQLGEEHPADPGACNGRIDARPATKRHDAARRGRRSRNREASLTQCRLGH